MALVRDHRTPRASRSVLAGDAERARPLLDAARRQFETIGMTGWIRRADDLATRLNG